MERPVEFESDGVTLRGILHAPPDATRCVVFVNAGFQPRAGPHRIYVRMARKLSREGIASLRFDLPGIGNSGGQLADRHFDALSVEGTQAAVGYVLNETGAQRVSILGMCAGARNAAKAAAEDARVDSIIMLSLPIRYFPPDSASARYHVGIAGKHAGLAIPALREEVSGLIRRAGTARSWARFFTFKTHYATAMRSIRDYAITRLSIKEGSHLGEAVVNACMSFLKSDRRALFVYGEHDLPLIRDFEENMQLALEARWPGSAPYDLRVVEGATHTFSSRRCHEELTATILDWLQAG